MKSSGRRNPDLRNGDENDFVDYEEESEEEQKSNTSVPSNTQTSIPEQVADITDISATQPDDSFNIEIKDNEDTSQHESLSTSNQSDFTHRVEYDGNGFLKSYTPNVFPRLDFGQARLGIDVKLLAFIRNEMFHKIGRASCRERV